MHVGSHLGAPLTTQQVFITGRTIIGLGLASFLMTSLIVVQEIPHPRSRSFVAQSWVRLKVWFLADDRIRTTSWDPSSLLGLSLAQAS